MTYTIAVAGKGGVGKTSLSAALVIALSKVTSATVLAVDADANHNLGEKLGVEVRGTIGELRDELRDSVPSGVTKADHFSRRLAEMTVEGNGFDLVTMGRPEGEGCYCYVNNLLRDFFSRSMERYRFAVIDNEAGMEHLSRKVLGKVDVLLIVSDATKVGVITARRISDLTDEVGMEVGRKVLVVSRAERLHPLVEAEATGFDDIVLIPHDPEVEALNTIGAPLTGLAADAPLLRAACRIARSVG